MKTFQFCIRFAVVLVAVAGIVPPVPAQSPVQRQQAFGASERFFPALNRVLTDEQRQSLRAALESQRGKIPALEEKMRASRRALLDAAVGGKFDENLVRQNAEASARAESELTVIYVRALSEMKPPLSAQQLQQLKNFQPGQFPSQAGPAAESATETHLELPPPLPRDTNDLPVAQ